ncbi:hypothetical protein BsubNA05_32350 [Bacillus subtilis]|nr:Hypothetical protein YfmN [Bacillus subtilis subsp. subtilis str. BSP1]BET56129.1 hypothetical protein BsubNA05_32350 [Bacillus subtilis]
MKAKPDEYDHKCLETLYQYIHSVMKNSFSRSSGLPLGKMRRILSCLPKEGLTLDEFTSPLQLILKDRELLRIVQNKWQ